MQLRELSEVKPSASSRKIQRNQHPSSRNYIMMLPSLLKSVSGNPFLKDCDQPTETAYRNGVHEYLGKETAR